jgi:regulator of replication initiation timing
MDEYEAGDRVEDLQQRLRAAAEQVEALRTEAGELADELRNRLHALTLQRKVLERLDEERRKRMQHRSGNRNYEA